MADIDRPFELLPIFRERVWGRESLAPFFPQHPVTNRIGEIWFTFEENLTSLGINLKTLLTHHPEILGNAANQDYPGICPILIKLLFTTERLSIQVHPDDTYAKQHHQSLGKTEAWYVLDSQPPGEIGVGFSEPLSPEHLGKVAQSGEIVQRLDWRKVDQGEVIFIPAGTVHAIGAGLTICEIQENSDITYRLYDYGRPRELHLEHGARVAHLSPHLHQASPKTIASGREELVACEYFRIERLRPNSRIAIASGLPYYLLAICVAGSGTMDGTPTVLGQAWFIPAQGTGTLIEAPGSEWILSYTSTQPCAGILVS